MAKVFMVLAIYIRTYKALFELNYIWGFSPPKYTTKITTHCLSGRLFCNFCLHLLPHGSQTCIHLILKLNRRYAWFAFPHQSRWLNWQWLCIWYVRVADAKLNCAWCTSAVWRLSHPHFLLIWDMKLLVALWISVCPHTHHRLRCLSRLHARQRQRDRET